MKLIRQIAKNTDLLTNYKGVFKNSGKIWSTDLYQNRSTLNSILKWMRQDISSIFVSSTSHNGVPAYVTALIFIWLEKQVNWSSIYYSSTTGQMGYSLARLVTRESNDINIKLPRSCELLIRHFGNDSVKTSKLSWKVFHFRIVVLYFIIVSSHFHRLVPGYEIVVIHILFWNSLKNNSVYFWNLIFFECRNIIVAIHAEAWKKINNETKHTINSLTRKMKEDTFNK